MRQHMPSILLSLAVLLALQVSTTLNAEVLQYKDEHGKIHYVDRLQNVPPAYRSQIKLHEPLPTVSPQGTNDNTSKPRVEILVASWCAHCISLEKFLRENNIPYSRYDVEHDSEGMKRYNELGGGGVPIVRIGTAVMRGFDAQQILRLLNKK